MKRYTYLDKPLEVHGLPFFEEDHRLCRLPDGVLEKLKAENPTSGVIGLSRRTPGTRVMFRTNSKKLLVHMELEEMKPDIGMSIFACQSVNVMLGRENPCFAGLVNPPDYNTTSAEKTFTLSGETQDVTLWLPRNEHVTELYIEIADDAEILPPTPYKYSKPILFYGSSITEGGCCCRVTNVYNSIISQELDTDFINFGFSGSARGEMAIADCIAEIPMSIFVYDYDHNAPSVEHLRNTHEPFFKRIREKNPELPVIMVTRPSYTDSADTNARAEVIHATYKNALDSGDKNVYFVDGRKFFGEKGGMCSCDGCHPNDLGFYLMAETIKPIIRSILESGEK